MSGQPGSQPAPVPEASGNDAHATIAAEDEVLGELCAAAVRQLEQSGFPQARLVLIDQPGSRFRMACGDLDFSYRPEQPQEEIHLISEPGQNPVLEVRLQHAGQHLGSLAVRKAEEEPFSSADMELIRALASQVAASLALARRLAAERSAHLQAAASADTLQKQVAFQRLLLSITQANFETESPAATLQVIAEQMGALFGPATCTITLWDSEAHEVRLAASALPEKNGRKPAILLPEIQALTIICLDAGHGMPVEDVHTQRGVSNLAPRMRDVASILVLPLQVAGRSGDRLPLGAVLLAYADPQNFTPEVLAPVEQASAALAQTLHRQRTLTEAQRKAQENNILQQAGELIHSSLEQDEVIHTILQQWSSLMPGIAHSILLRRDGNVTVVAAEGETRLTSMQGQFFPVSGVNPISVVLHSGKPLKIKHGRGEYNNLPDEVFTPNCVWLGVPLPYRGRVIGLLMAEHHKVHDYTPGQVRLAHLFARQVAAALEHARLYAREQNRVRELNALQKATAALLSTLNLEELLGQILDAAIMALPGSTHGSIYLIAPQTGKLQIRAMYGPAATRGHQIALITSEPYVIRAVTERKPILIPVIEDSEPLSGAAPASRPLSAMVAPLLLRDRVVGALFVGAGEPHAYSSENLSLLESFATTATEAIHNAMLHAEVKSYAITDPLTGLYNRRGLFDLGEPEVERARRFKRPLSLIMFDVDNFKLINDQDGHDAGDEILREIASRCRKFSRSMDILGRVGGDEFVLILLEADLHAAQEIAQRLLNGIGGQPVHLPNGAKRITVSMGVSLASSGAPDLASIIKAADTAMYASKAQGGNCISIR